MDRIKPTTDEKTCNFCERKEFTRKLILADKDGIVLDYALFCGECYPEMEIFIREKRLSY